MFLVRCRRSIKVKLVAWDLMSSFYQNARQVLTLVAKDAGPKSIMITEINGSSISEILAMEKDYILKSIFYMSTIIKRMRGIT